MKKPLKVILVVFIGITVLGFLIAIFGDSENSAETLNTKSNEQQVAPSPPPKPPVQIALEKIDKANDELRIAYSGLVRNDIQSVLDEADFFAGIHDMIVVNDTFTADSVHGKFEALKEKLIKTQKKEFPKMRADYSQISSKLLWEEDIKVIGNGTTLTFIGGLFAANKNIKASYEQIQGAVAKLRFQRINFKWYSEASEYTYYSTRAPKDEELIYP